MKAETILSELAKYLLPIQIEQLRLASSLQKGVGAIVICMTISDIVTSYHSTHEDEHAVACLLSDLCAIHFSKNKQNEKESVIAIGA